MEDDRINTSIIDIEKNINQLARSINGIPTEFIFDLDEMGVSEFEDGRERSVIVPITYKLSKALFPVSRKEKHTTCLACINYHGLVCPTQYALQRSTLNSEIFKYLDFNSIQCVHTDTGYINTQSFIHWLNPQFLPSLHELRKRYLFNGPAVLILDGFSAHYNSYKKKSRGM